MWAWREGRAGTLGESADRVLCLFPMEPPIYARHGVDAVFVGHPLADAIALEPDRDATRKALGVSSDATVLAVLPGSRLGEIERMLPPFLAAAALLRQRMGDLQLLIPAATPAAHAAIQRILDAGSAPPSARVLAPGGAQDAMIASDGVLLASGTAALEAMLCKRPMVVGHRVAGSTHAIVRTFGLLKSAHVSLPNVLAGAELVPELLQRRCTPERLADALCAVLAPAWSARVMPRFEAIHRQLRRDADARAAEAIAGLLSMEHAP